MLDKQLEEYNKQKEEEQQKEEELNKANLISVSNINDTMDITIKDNIYNNVNGTKDTSGTYKFRLIYKSTNTIVSGSTLYLLSTQSVDNTNWNTAHTYRWSCSLRDSNDNIYNLTDIKIPTKNEIMNNNISNDSRALGYKYWTDTLTTTGSSFAYVIWIDGTSDNEFTSRTSNVDVVPMIKVTLS